MCPRGSCTDEERDIDHKKGHIVGAIGKEKVRDLRDNVGGEA